jgi:hypothetical protein
MRATPSLVLTGNSLNSRLRSQPRPCRLIRTWLAGNEQLVLALTALELAGFGAEAGLGRLRHATSAHWIIARWDFEITPE